MRKILKTSRGCPITSLYLSLGQTPARFEILKMRLLFIKYILEQPIESMVFRMLKLQLEKPMRGDWASTCLRDLESINLKLTLDDIKSMKKEKYKTILKEKVNETALKYLVSKQGKKGREINYPSLEMSDYLLPFNKQTIEEKCEMFALKNSMINIKANFSSKSEFKCECGELENMNHIYECKNFNEKTPEIPFEKNYNGNLNEQKFVYKRFKQNMQTKEERNQTSYPSVQSDIPLYTVWDQ